MAIISHLRRANIPWLHHLLFVLSLFLVPTEQLRTLFLVHLLLTYLFDTEPLLKALQDSSEPPLIPHPYLPFLGHVIGIFWHGAKYFEIVNLDTQYPIFTLQTLNGRTIGVTSPSLAAPIQRASKNTSFYGMILEVTARLVGLDEASMKVVRWNINGDLGQDEGLMNESHAMVSSVLSPGPILTQISTTQLDAFSSQLNDLLHGHSSLEISLMDFVKRNFTTANALTIYGPQNPFILYPDLVQKFWDYEAGMIGVMANILPWITARKAWKARRDINTALQEYVEKEYYKTASPLIQRRVAINLKHGLTTKMTGRCELILLFGIIGNAVPTTFWLLANLFSRPDLLSLIREELSSQAIHVSPSNPKEKTIKISKLKTHCPLLVSTYRETLRQIANLASVRLVMGTHTITAPSHPPYLLKKGAMVQIAGGAIHASESVWGPDAKSFIPERFISSVSTSSSEDFAGETTNNTDLDCKAAKATALPKNVPSAAYRAFGGGSVICPGRHFAQTEILGFVAAVVCMFEVAGRDGKTMVLPERNDRRIPLSVMKPVVEPWVRMRRREGEEDVVWRLEL